ncbi:MAG: NAD-dependent DNA ligase LigA [Nitrospinota bacterium]
MKNDLTKSIATLREAEIASLKQRVRSIEDELSKKDASHSKEYNELTDRLSKFENKDFSSEEFLKTEIARHNILYHQQNEPEISDYEYDQLVRNLLELESHSELDLDSPTKRVGAKPSSSFKQIKHNSQRPMLSLNNAFNLKELEQFYNKVRAVNNQKVELLVSPKIDGVALSLIYEKNKLLYAATRGDGTVGEDVTHNVTAIRSIPKELKLTENKIDRFEVRGEVYISKADFEETNQGRLEDGLQPFANPRNSAAGALRQLDQSKSRSDKLGFIAYDFFETALNGRPSISNNIASQTDAINKLEWLGFKTLKSVNQLATDFSLLKNIVTNFQSKRNSFPYEVDGIVISANSYAIADELATTSKAPLWAIAYKLASEQQRSRIVNIKFNVGRTGLIVPVASIEPVLIGGSTVSNVTLHNEDQIIKKDIKLNDYAFFSKAGDIIPELVKVIVSKRDGRQKEIIFPTDCPSCKAKLRKVPFTKGRNKEPQYQQSPSYSYFCDNDQCEAKTVAKILHFVSRDAMAIDHLGVGLIEKLVKNKIIADVADIYDLTREALLKLDKVQDKSADNILASINKSKTVLLPKLLFGLGIKNVGKNSATILATQFHSISQLKEASVMELAKVAGIGTLAGEYIYDFFHDESNIKLLDRLENSHLKIKVDRKNHLSKSPFYQKNIVITGSFSKLTRFEIKDQIETIGGFVKSSISNNSDFLIKGDEPGSKLQKALAINSKNLISIISEDQFIDLIDRTPLLLRKKRFSNSGGLEKISEAEIKLQLKEVEAVFNERICKNIDYSLDEATFLQMIHEEAGNFKKKRFFIKGQLKTLTKDQLEQLIAEKGAILKDALHKNVDYLIKGENPDHKLEEAIFYNNTQKSIEIIDEDQFMKMIEK